MTRLIQDQASAVVRERDRRRFRAMAGVLCLGCVLVGGVLGYVWLQVQRVRVSYELEDLRALRVEVEEQNRKLRLELLTLRAFPRVDSAARRLGLREPGRDQVRIAREFVVPRPGDQDGVALRTATKDNGMTAPPGRP